MSLYLLSYPRSGNFWVRYIIEYISRRPTQGYNSTIDGPIGARHHIGVDLDDDVIAIKSHAEIGNADDEIILIIRDYKEAITRHAKETIKHAQNDGYYQEDMKLHFIHETQGVSNIGVDYIGILERYDSFPGRKMFLYYEDLLLNPKFEISKIVDFMNLDFQRFEKFMTKYYIHHNRSVESYHAGSHTKGTSMHHHISSFSNEYIKFMDEYIKNLHPVIYNKYLSRYGW